MKRRLFLASAVSALAGCGPIGSALNQNDGVRRTLESVEGLNHLLIGTVPERHFQFTGACRDQTIQCPEWKNSFHRLAPHLQFGWTRDSQGFRSADPEKAVLDCLYYHQKGMRFSFDIETDIDRSGLSREKFLDYVLRYANPRFQSRCRRWLDAV